MLLHRRKDADLIIGNNEGVVAGVMETTTRCRAAVVRRCRKESELTAW